MLWEFLKTFRMKIFGRVELALVGVKNAICVDDGHFNQNN